MNSNDLFENLRNQLQSRGVRADYINRLLEELQSHYQSAMQRHALAGLSDQQADAEALKELGTVDDIVHSTLDSLRRESFVGRHRILCMVLIPPILMVFCNLVVVILPDLVEKFLTIRAMWYFGNYFSSGMPIALVLCNVLIPLAFLQWLWRLGHRKFCGTGFTLTGCALLILCSLLFQISVSSVGPHGEIMPPPFSWILSRRQYQLLLLAGYGVLFYIWRRRHNKSRPAAI